MARGWQLEALAALVGVLACGCPESVEDTPVGIIFGPYDRGEVPLGWRPAASAVVALVPVASFEGERPNLRPLSSVFCADEPLAREQAVGVFEDVESHEYINRTVSAFLVTSQHVVTARHVLCQSDRDPVIAQECRKNCAAAYRVVFGYDRGGGPIDTYAIAEIVAAGDDWDQNDWVIARLDRPVPPSVAMPLEIDETGWEHALDLAAIAYPFGTSRTFVYGAHRLRGDGECFQSTLDCVSGCSGAPVFDARADDHRVIGMTIAAGGTYVCPGVPPPGCLREYRCPASGCGCNRYLDTTSISSPSLFGAILEVKAGEEPMHTAPTEGNCIRDDMTPDWPIPGTATEEPSAELEESRVCGVEVSCRPPSRPCPPVRG